MATDDHKSEASLLKEIAEVAKDIEVGATYRHYKGQEYKVLTLAFNESDMEVTVVYQAQYGDKLTFLRPAKAWQETIEVDGRTVPRFVKV
jgi:hypothetical protein